MKENIEMEKRKEKAFISGIMETDMKVIGEMI